MLALLRLDRDFLPPFNEGACRSTCCLPPGTSLAKSNEVAARVEERLQQVDDIAAFVRKTGRAELDEHAEGVNVSEIIVTLDPDIAALARRGARRDPRGAGRYSRHRDRGRAAAGPLDLAHALGREGPGGDQALRRRPRRAAPRGREDEGRHRRRARRPRLAGRAAGRTSRSCESKLDGDKLQQSACGGWTSTSSSKPR